MKIKNFFDKTNLIILTIFLTIIFDYNYQRIKYEKIDNEIKEMNEKEFKNKIGGVLIKDKYKVSLKKDEDFYYHLFGVKFFPKIVKIPRKIYEIVRISEITIENKYYLLFTDELDNFYIKGIPYEKKKEIKTVFQNEDIDLKNCLRSIIDKITSESSLDYYSENEIFTLLNSSEKLFIKYLQKGAHMNFLKENEVWSVDYINYNHIENNKNKTFFRYGDRAEIIDHIENWEKKIIYFNKETLQIHEEYIYDYEDHKNYIKKYNIFGDLIYEKKLNN